MERLLGPIIWVLLVPYFAVASLNLRSPVGASRASANRTNAQLTVALILTSFEIALLAAGGLSRGRLWETYRYIICGLLLILPWIAVARWLGKENEADYRNLYQLMPVGVRLGFGIASAAFVAACWWFIGQKA